MGSLLLSMRCKFYSMTVAGITMLYWLKMTKPPAIPANPLPANHKPPRVIIAGHVCIDHNETESGSYTKWGSPAMYIADYLKTRQQLTSCVITSYGADFIPYANDVYLLPTEPRDGQSLIFRNIITAENRTWYSENIAAAVPPVLDTLSVAALRSADIFILGTILPNYDAAYVKEMMSYLPKNCLTGLVAQGYLRLVTPDSKITPKDFDEAADIVSLFDITILSQDDHPKAHRLAEQWSDTINRGSSRAVIVTEGESGARLYQPDNYRLIPTEPVKESDISDSVGCGDVFFAALMHAFYQCRDLDAAVMYAHQAARHKLLSKN